MSQQPPHGPVQLGLSYTANTDKSSFHNLVFYSSQLLELMKVYQMMKVTVTVEITAEKIKVIILFSASTVKFGV